MVDEIVGSVLEGVVVVDFVVDLFENENYFENVDDLPYLFLDYLM